MLGRIAAAAALIALAGCAGMESAGRNASRSPEPARVASAPAVEAAPAQAAPSSPAPVAAAPLPPPSAAPPVRAAQDAAPATAQADRPVTTAARNDDEVVVPGQRERQVQPPNGDPRSNAERMQDIRAWDQCVVRVQSAYDRDPMRPQLETPEEYCRESLGMADRTSIPISRLESR
ncbi:MAG TPA: hypothetical protein VFO00_13820 [Vitreimonas sp.]|nr:hypothetical protein [Vitreimonas sp.]